MLWLFTPRCVAFFRKGGTEKIISLATSDITEAEDDVSDGVSTFAVSPDNVPNILRP